MPEAALNSTSGTQLFNPGGGDYVLDALGRLQIHPPEITSNHWYQARLSANFLQVEMANVGLPLLWKQQLLQIPLQPGVSLYTLPYNVVAAFDAYIRLYTPSNAQSFAGSFTTTLFSLTVQVNQPLHGYANGTMVYYPIPISVGGIIIQGPYLVTAVIDQNNYQITAQTYPSSGVSGGPLSGGGIILTGGGVVLTGGSGAGFTDGYVVPIITATQNLSTFNVLLPAHGMSTGQLFNINVSLTVGGVQLGGGFLVVGVTDQNNFTIQGPQTASSTQTLGMNNNLAQAQTQAYGVDPEDFILYPISRSEYAAQPDKGPNLQFRPTTFWFIRTRQPQIQFWVPPDNNAYIFNLWVQQQQDDFVPQGSVGIDIPWRYGDAFAAGLASKLFLKFPPKPATGITYQMIKADYDAYPDGALWRAIREDIERVPTMISPGLTAYFR